MSHFLIYAARLQDAGVCSLWVSLGSNKEGTRLMHISPDASTPRDLAARFPTRTFELCGTDRLLEQLQDDMAYAEGGPTPEMLAAAIERHPLAADDLREWYADWLLNPPPTDEEIAEAEADVDDAMVQRVTQRTLGVMRGLEIARTRDAMKAPVGVRALSSPEAMAAEYQAWIDFFHAGEGDYNDFMRKRTPGVAPALPEPKLCPRCAQYHGPTCPAGVAPAHQTQENKHGR